MFIPALVLALHLLAALIWVGGMFFAYLVLRPSLLGWEQQQALRLWRQVFVRFFRWVWVAVVVLIVSGYWMLFVVYGGFAGATPLIHLMQSLGLLMAGLFVWLYGVRWRQFQAALDSDEFEAAAIALGKIRHIVVVNLVLGLINSAIGGLTPWIGI